IYGLQLLATPETTKFLLASLKDKSQGVRNSAAAGLKRVAAHLEPSQCIAIMNGIDRNTKISVLQASSAFDLALRRKLLRLGLKDKDVFVRETALFGNCQRGKESVLTAEDLASSLNSDKPNIRRAAAMAAGVLKDKDASATILKKLAVDKDFGVRLKVAMGLKNCSPKEAVTIAKMLLKDTGFAIRVSAIRSLGEIQAPEAIALVVDFAKDKHITVRYAAVHSLARQNAKELSEYLAAVYNEADYNEKMRLIPYLGRLPADEANKLLTKAIKSTHISYRSSVAHNLKGYPKDIAFACASLLIEDKSSKIRLPVAGFLAKHKDDKKVWRMLKKLETDSHTQISWIAKEAMKSRQSSQP
ncbi:MAG: hypothetical protein DRI46_13115, partial [Chloroflexi bacterium]